MRIMSGGGSAPVPPAPPPPPPPPPKPRATQAPARSSQPDTSPPSSFDHAVQQAFTARTAVDGLPPSAHGYETATIVKPGDTVWGIATSHKDLLGAEEADNAQITDANLVRPGQVVFSPGQSPVSPRTTADIEAAENNGTQQHWTTVEHDIANDLRAQAGGQLLPERVVRPTVQALDQWAVGSGNLRKATQTAYDQVYKGWQEQGTTGQQLAPLLTDRQAAVQDEEALTHLRAPVNHMLVAGEEQQAGQAWSKVQQGTQQWLQSTIGLRAFPEDLAAHRVSQLDALFPNDQRFAAANQRALQAATQTWRALGITHDHLDPVLHAYNAYETAVQQRQQALQNPHLHNEDPTAPSLLNQEVNTAWSRLQGATEQQLKGAAKPGQSPQQRSEAIFQRAAIFHLVGPQTRDFGNAVDAADTYLQVTQPAQQVASAYQRGGASAGARALLTATQNAVPGHAGSIIAASQPTINKIAVDLDTMAKNSFPDSGPLMSIYGDLSAAVEQTDHGADAQALSTQTTQAADQIAGALASHLPTTSTYLPIYGTDSIPANIYAGAAQEAIGNGRGATLSLALSAQLQQRGRSAAASQVLEGSALGFDALKTRTDNDVQGFAKVTANLEQLRSSWGPFMSTAQLDQATAGYAKRNPQFVDQFAKTLSAVQRDGTAVVQARQAFSAYQSKIRDLSNHKDLVDAANNLTGRDRSTLFAVQESGQVTKNVAQALTAAAAVPNAGAAYPTALAAPGVLRSIRTAISQYLKSPHTTPLTAADGSPGTPNIPTNLGLSVSALGLTTPTALSELQNFNQLDFGGKAVAVYNSLGFAKYLTEAGSYTSRLAATSGIRYLGAIANSKVGNWLSSVTTDGTRANAAYQMFGSFYYLTGAFANGVSGEEAAASGDPVSAALDSTNALGNVLLAGNASKGVIASALEGVGIDAGEDTAINAALDWAGPAGAFLSVLAQSGLFLKESLDQKDAQNALQAQGQGFLEDGLHLRPAIAQQLADVSDNRHVGPAPVLLAYARQYHIKPQALLDFLNKQNPTDVGNFVYLSEFLTPDRNGHYKATDSSDKPNPYYIPGDPYQNSVEFSPHFAPPMVDSPNTPASLRGLHYWAQSIFPGQPTS
jgi:hypothetical protein